MAKSKAAKKPAPKKVAVKITVKPMGKMKKGKC